ncbi:MAG: SpoIID/LytB domain-containing protein [Sphingobacteriaceae bacterium]|nr:SpoIID/LytB domain-containing protein [Sphingobacteriaceae bacterium]
MKILKKITILLFICFLFIHAATFVPTERLNIRIFSHLKVNALQLNVNAGTYKITVDGKLLEESKGESIYKLVLSQDSIAIYKSAEYIGKYHYVKFSGDELAEVKIKLINPERKIRTYQNDVSFSVTDGYIKVLNDVILDNYIAGVTEAEAGRRSSLEFYKVQALLARTFALSSINKHVLEGFSLCDQVHCQAYFGKPRDVNIFNAIAETKGKVVVDENLDLIVAAFHSNSGGQTANSEDVWGSYRHYLRSQVDSFSHKMPNAKWERKMLTEDWLTYLKLKHNYAIDEPNAVKVALNFKQETRKVYLECNNTRVPLKNVRQDLQLKSTFFSIYELNNDSIVFRGRGYGHGLGMCQEGAMNMCKKGYSYIDVLHYYYRNIRIIDMRKLNFFKDE